MKNGGDVPDNSGLAFICPRCGGGEPRPDAGALRCPACGWSYEVRDGVACLGDEGPYYGEVPRERMKAIVEEARAKGWKRALFDSFYKSNNFLYRIAASETRADWLYLLDLDRRHKVLDVGSGWGTEAIPLARNSGLVAALDGTSERLEFVVVRAAQEGVSNVEAVRGSILAPPFAPGQFDLVVMNGVLEWVGAPEGAGDPLELQETALKNAFGLLKKGGRLYLGIENSHGFKYLLGEPDDHTGLSDITFLPRELANRAMRAAKGRDYRTYTHSYEGYRALLQGAGFWDIEFHYPIGDYKIFTYLVPLEGRGPYGYYMDNLAPAGRPGTLAQNVKNLERAAYESGALKDRVSSYSIIAEKV